MKSWPKIFLQPEVLKQRMLVLSALDILMCQEEWLRRYQFDPQWDENTTFASVSNGSGDDLYILFTPEGVIVKGFDHESEMSPHAREEYEVWPGIYEQVPLALLHRLDDEALTKEDVTFCLWRVPTDHVWKTGDIHNPQGLDDGSDFLLGMIYDHPEDYVEWAEAYYEVKVPLAVVGYTFSNTSMTKEMMMELNPEVDLEMAMKELQAIGFTVT